VVRVRHLPSLQEIRFDRAYHYNDSSRVCSPVNLALRSRRAPADTRALTFSKWKAEISQ
jgi:hypothetical protein